MVCGRQNPLPGHLQQGKGDRLLLVSPLAHATWEIRFRPLQPSELPNLENALDTYRDGAGVIARIVLGLSEQQAAVDAGRSVETWRRYEATGRGHCTWPVVRFAKKRRLSLDWLVAGVGRPPLPRS